MPTSSLQTEARLMPTNHLNSQSSSLVNQRSLENMLTSWALLLSAMFLMSACYPERVESIKLMNQGIKEYNGGSSSAAVRLLARSAETDPTNHRALFYRGLILNEMGRLEERNSRFEQAVRSLKGSIRIHAEDPEAYYQLGVSLSELGKDIQAIEAFSDATAIAPHGEASYRRGLIHLKREEYNKAQESFRAAIIAKPDLGLAYTALSQLYRQFRKKSAAVTVLKNAIENDPEEMNHFRDLGEVYSSLKQFSKAIQLFETAHQEKPSNAPLTYLLGEAYFMHGDLQSAEIYVKRYLRMGHTRAEKLMISKAKEILRSLRK